MKLPIQAIPVCAAGRRPEGPTQGKHANKALSAEQGYMTG